MAFTVLVQPSGRQFEVNPGECILPAGIRQGIGLPYGCKDGACGSCKVQLSSGSVTHGPHQSKALSEAEEAQGFVLTCCAVPQTDVILEAKQVTEVGTFAPKKMPARVASLAKASHDVMILKLQLPAADPMQYHAGQYVDFLLRDGARRSYSMANASTSAPPVEGTPPTGPLLELHLRHMPGGKFTDHVFSAMKEKEITRVEGPFGSFYLREESSLPIVFVASGTGFAPIKAIIEHMRAKNVTRAATLYWGGRRPSDLYMADWVAQQCDAMPNLRYVPVVSDAQPEDNWVGRSGFVHSAVLADFTDLSGHQVYACGAPIVVESAQRDFTALRGLSPDEFFADSFTSAADSAPAASPAA
jgi:CDP-4-dehydro-6-deoxyglucose reductase, E3